MINEGVSQEPEILLEELLNGPYFGDTRNLALTSYRVLKVFQAEGASADPSTRNLLERHDIDIEQSRTYSLNTVGTTDKVRGGLSQEDKVVLVKAIKSSYDRIGLDTQEYEDTLINIIDYATPEQRKTDTGKVTLYEFRDSFVGWSPNRLSHDIQDYGSCNAGEFRDQDEAEC